MDCLKLCRRCRLRRESQVLQVSRFCRRCGFAGTATFAGAVSSADAAAFTATAGIAGCRKFCRHCGFAGRCRLPQTLQTLQLLQPLRVSQTQQVLQAPRAAAPFASKLPADVSEHAQNILCRLCLSRCLQQAAIPRGESGADFRPAFSHFVRCAKIRRSVFTECYLCRRCEYPRGKGGATSAFAAHSVSAARAGCVQPAPCFPRLPHGLAAWQQESLQKKISAVLCLRLPAVLRLASLPRGYLVPPARIAAVSFRPA